MDVVGVAGAQQHGQRRVPAARFACERPTVATTGQDYI
jgi:hypothetical protein